MGSDAIRLHRGPGVSFMWPIDWILIDHKATILKKPLTKSRLAKEEAKTQEMFIRLKKTPQFDNLIELLRKKRGINPSSFNVLLNEARDKEREAQQTRDIPLKQRPSDNEINKKFDHSSEARIKVNTYASRLFRQDLHQLRQTLNKNDMDLPSSIDDAIAFYILTGKESVLFREKCHVSIVTYESGEHKILIEVTPDAGLKDIERIWPTVEFFQKNLPGCSEKKTTPKGSKERRDFILRLHKLGYNNLQIQAKLELQDFPYISKSGIYKIFKKVSR